MNQILPVISQLLPVILLIALGTLLKRSGILQENGIKSLKKIIVNVGLPAALFISFLQMDLEIRLLPLILGIFTLNLLLLFLGSFKGIRGEGRYERFLYTGFEYGMFAMGLFSVAYGRENIYSIALVDLGHEIFIWFLLVPLISTTASGKSSGIKKTVLSFIKSPIIIAILTGIAANLLGLGKIIKETPLLSSVFNTAEMISAMTGPLILIVLGAGLSFSLYGGKLSLKLLLIRFPLVTALALTANHFILDRVLHLDPGYRAALFVLLTSPPPYVLTVYMGDEDKKEKGAVNSALTIYTLCSLLAFIIYFTTKAGLG